MKFRKMEVKHILIAEDNDTKFSVIHKYLVDKGYKQYKRVKSYNGTLNAIHKSDKYDLLILDMQMPWYDGSSNDIHDVAGFDVLRMMWLQDKIIPTIVCSSNEVKDDRLEKANPDSYRGQVKYSYTNIDWQRKMSQLIDEIFAND